MKLLVDTQAWLWFFLGDDQLSSSAAAQIADADNELFLSPASIWEISIKISLGKYALNLPYSEFMQRALAGYTILDIRVEHTEQVSRLPFHHRDPFDRLIIAQAIATKAAIVTSDTAFAAYGVQLIW